MRLRRGRGGTRRFGRVDPDRLCGHERVGVLRRQAHRVHASQRSQTSGTVRRCRRGTAARPASTPRRRRGRSGAADRCGCRDGPARAEVVQKRSASRRKRFRSRPARRPRTRGYITSNSASPACERTGEEVGPQHRPRRGGRSRPRSARRARRAGHGEVRVDEPDDRPRRGTAVVADRGRVDPLRAAERPSSRRRARRSPRREPSICSGTVCAKGETLNHARPWPVIPWRRRRPAAACSAGGSPDPDRPRRRVAERGSRAAPGCREQLPCQRPVPIRPLPLRGERRETARRFAGPAPAQDHRAPEAPPQARDPRGAQTPRQAPVDEKAHTWFALSSQTRALSSIASALEGGGTAPPRVGVRAHRSARARPHQTRPRTPTTRTGCRRARG